MKGAGTAPLLSPGDLQADLRQLVNLLIESHPDPFSGIGGAVFFYRQANAIANSISVESMTASDFLRLLRPLVASVQDGHTTIFDAEIPDEQVDVRRIGHPDSDLRRPWVCWDIVEEQLYISKVYRNEDRHLLGARLRGIEGVSFAELAERMGQIRGFDNIYNNLIHLIDALRHPTLLPDLLETSILAEQLVLQLELSDQRSITTHIPVASRPPAPAIVPDTKIQLIPISPTRIEWQFIDDRRQIAYLRIGPMMWYREAFEVWRSHGYHHNLGDHLDRLVRRVHGDNIPETLDERIAAVPSATDLFRELLVAMREARSGTLIVDLQTSTGGNSTIATILQYFLYGINGLIDYDGGYQVQRYSPLYFDNNRNRNPAIMNPLIGGYDFSEENAWQQRHKQGMNNVARQQRRSQILGDASISPTFARALASDDGGQIWRPEVIALTSARTYSAGFDLAAGLYKQGAPLIGVPSSQAGNCFIDTMRYTLTHSGLQGRISHKWSLLFPDNPDTGHIVKPHVELTYDRLASLDFDPNATVKVAIDFATDR